MNNLITVIDVYGRPVRISHHDYEGPRTQLPLYNRNGERVIDSRSYHTNPCKHSGMTHIHRANIAYVKE